MKKAKINQILLLLLMGLGLASCLAGIDSGGPGRPSIELGEGTENSESDQDPDDGTCFESNYDLLNFECATSCPDFTEQVDTTSTSGENKVNDYISTYLTPDTSLTSTEKSDILQDVAKNRDICLPIKRPTNKIEIDEGFCACKDGRHDSLGDCQSFCASKPSSATSTLYGTVTLDPEVEANPDFGNLHNWCTRTIQDGGSSPSCKLQATRDGTTQEFQIRTISGSNSFTADITTLLPYNKPFIFRIVETGSGSNAQTEAKQITRYDYPEDNDGNTLPETQLAFTAISQYNCITALIGTVQNSTDITTADIIERYYYFPGVETPPALPPEVLSVFCHDIQKYPRNDNVSYPRLNLIPGHFGLWDKKDLRFLDYDKNGKRDINDILERKLSEEYSVSASLNLFQPITLPLVPSISIDGSASGNQVEGISGYYMQAFTNISQGGTPFCPTEEHYNSNDPTFRVMKDIIGGDTEGIYFALREPKTFVFPQTNQLEIINDVLMVIRESQLKKIWFYFDNGQHVEHNNITSTQRDIHFYWPPDPVNPFTKKSTQSLFTIRTIKEIRNGGTAPVSSAIGTDITAADRRFGCIPVIDPN
ncbi:MAG: hypothetical protein ACPGJV_07100 [Bacteriovoracaceae bacterium]